MQDERDLAEGFLPCRVVASNKAGEIEHHVGDFRFGVVLKGMVLHDVETNRPIANMAKVPGTGTPLVPMEMVWEVPHLNMMYHYLFIQVMPGDAPKEINIPGEGRKLVF